MVIFSSCGKLTAEKVPTEYVIVDGLGVGDVSHVVLRDRLQMAQDGMFVVTCTFERKTGKLIGSPDIISRGFVFLKEARELVDKARAKTRKILHDADPRSPAFAEYAKNKIRDAVAAVRVRGPHGACFCPVRPYPNGR